MSPLSLLLLSSACLQVALGVGDQPQEPTQSQEQIQEQEQAQCVKVASQLSGALAKSQLFVVNVFETHLMLVISQEDTQLIYEVPLSHLDYNTTDLSGCKPVKWQQQWPKLAAQNYGSLVARAPSQAIAMNSGGPMIVFSTGNSGNTSFNNPSTTAFYVNLTIVLLDPFLINYNVPYYMKNQTELEPFLAPESKWLPSPKCDHFYLLSKDTFQNRWSLQEVQLWFASNRRIIPVGPKLLLCAISLPAGTWEITTRELPYSGDCQTFPWMDKVMHSFTDGQWFRFFTSNGVYVFSHKALTLHSEVFNITEVSYKQLFVCRKVITHRPFFKMGIIITFGVLLVLIFTWCACTFVSVCHRKKKAEPKCGVIYSRITNQTRRTIQTGRTKRSDLRRNSNGSKQRLRRESASKLKVHNKSPISSR